MDDRQEWNSISQLHSLLNFIQEPRECDTDTVVKVQQRQGTDEEGKPLSEVLTATSSCMCMDHVQRASYSPGCSAKEEGE